VHGESLDFVQVYIDEEPEEVLATLGKVKSVVCASATARRLRELGIPEDLEIIEEDRILDQGGIEMLGRMLRQLL
jgi:GntR family transcriptional regulator